jgi:hypothetical protein
MIGLGLGSCQADLPSNSMYRFWHGPVVGLTVSHVWSSYATCLFLEFGDLTLGEPYTNRRGEVRRPEPRGEWGITSMESWPLWWLRQNGKLIGSCDDCRQTRLHRLKLLVGRRLNSLEIDASSKSTRLKFSLGLELTTETEIQRLRSEPHWLMRRPASGTDRWLPVALRFSSTSRASSS